MGSYKLKKRKDYKTTMTKVTFTMMQALRLTMMLDSHQGQRKNLRMVRELREKIGLTDQKLQDMLTPLPGGTGMAISPAVMTMDPVEVMMIPEEARKALEILDAETLTARDLIWAEPLAKELERATVLQSAAAA